MKISVNDQELFTLTEIQKKVICDYLHKDILENDLKRRLQWVLMHLYEQAFRQLKQNWEPILSNQLESLPTNKDDFAQLVFSHADYKDRASRDLESNPK